MKLLYATSVSYPSTRANRVQIRAMANAFAKHLGDSFVFATRMVDEMPGVHAISMGGSQRSFILGLRYVLLAKKHAVTHIFCREEQLLYWILFYAKLFRVSLVSTLEMHDIPESANTFFWKGVLSADHLVVLTSYLKEDLVARGVAAEKIQVLPDGVEERFLNYTGTKEEARLKLKLPSEKKIVVYNGHLYVWKGAETLAEAALLLPKDFLVCFVGGLPEMVEDFKERFKDGRLKFFGYRPYEEIPDWLAAGDVLALPNSGKQDISVRYTSPLKMIEFMAMGGNIVSSDLPSLRELLDEESAVFFEPDNARDLAEKIELALSDGRASERSAYAKQVASGLTWSNRVEAIVSSIDK